MSDLSLKLAELLAEGAALCSPAVHTTHDVGDRRAAYAAVVGAEAADRRAGERTTQPDGHVAEQTHPAVPIHVVAHDRPPLQSTAGHVADAVWQIDPKWSGHGLSLAPSPGHVKIQVPRPDPGHAYMLFGAPALSVFGGE